MKIISYIYILESQIIQNNECNHDFDILVTYNESINYCLVKMCCDDVDNLTHWKVHATIKYFTFQFVYIGRDICKGIM